MALLGVCLNGVADQARNKPAQGDVNLLGGLPQVGQQIAGQGHLKLGGTFHDHPPRASDVTALSHQPAMGKINSYDLAGTGLRLSQPEMVPVR